ncbi:Adenylate cyclase [Hyphomicrobiales bacterium]|nr:Adenylate cyclase [Hyphomicrobiales bacterium]CAH1697873.1 Adenylate cyclase [Hyphomicrobiales bacterium]CAI0347520.1 Adenylate cyclase [Hyphomicrobiales bacterium]
MESQRLTIGENSYCCLEGKLPDGEIRAQLERILASTEFSVPQRVRQFLTYVIHQTLAGHADRIKAYSVAVEVFGRDANFDIQNDPVVRIEAGRLRRALERYYLLAGSSDPILIEIPKGGYVPRFLRRDSRVSDAANAVPAAAPESLPGTGRTGFGSRWVAWGVAAAMACLALPFIWIAALPKPNSPAKEVPRPAGPSLIVRPFANLTGQPEINAYVAGLGEELLAQLSRFKELTVFGTGTPASISSGATAAEMTNPLGNRYLFEGGIRLSDGKLRVTARVLDGENSAIVWSGIYDADPKAADVVGVETTIASKIATAVAQPYGIIFSAAPRPARSRGVQNLDAYQCTHRFYRYRTVFSPSEHAATRACLEQVTARYPDFSTGWAMLAYLYLDEDRFHLNRRPDSSLERARGSAERAVRLDPENIRALQALMAVLYFSREPGEALRVGNQALALNPNDTELLGEFGSRVAQAGDWRRGASLLEEAMAKNPGHSDYYVGLLALAAYMQGDNARATDLIRRANLRQFSIYHFVAALVLARQGLQAEAARFRAEFLRLRPGFFDNFDDELNSRNFNARDRAILIRGAIEAGFPVPARFAVEAEQRFGALSETGPRETAAARSQP